MYIYEPFEKEKVRGYVAYKIIGSTNHALSSLSYLCLLNLDNSIIEGGVYDIPANIIKINCPEIKIFTKKDIEDRKLFIKNENDYATIEKIIRGIIKDELPYTDYDN